MTRRVGVNGVPLVDVCGDPVDGTAPCRACGGRGWELETEESCGRCGGRGEETER